MKDSKIFIRMSGLGGQGVVTAAHIIGVAAVKDGKYALVNPFFGAEKRLAPTESYVRISSGEIYDRGEVAYPDVIMIFHPHVITMGKSYTMPFYNGIRENGTIIINSDDAIPFSDDDIAEFKKRRLSLYFVPATKTAMNISGTALATNIVMVGMFAGITKAIAEEALRESIAERFGVKKFVASGSTAALDDAIKKKYAKVGQLLESNFQAVSEAIKLSSAIKSVI